LEFGKYFEIEKRIDINYNVRSARFLGEDRIKKIADYALCNSDFLKILSRSCFSMLPEEFEPRDHDVDPIF